MLFWLSHLCFYSVIKICIRQLKMDNKVLRSQFCSKDLHLSLSQYVRGDMEWCDRSPLGACLSGRGVTHCVLLVQCCLLGLGSPWRKGLCWVSADTLRAFPCPGSPMAAWWLLGSPLVVNGINSSTWDAEAGDDPHPSPWQKVKLHLWYCVKQGQTNEFRQRDSAGLRGFLSKECVCFCFLSKLTQK